MRILKLPISSSRDIPIFMSSFLGGKTEGTKMGRQPFLALLEMGPHSSQLRLLLTWAMGLCAASLLVGWFLMMD